MSLQSVLVVVTLPLAVISLGAWLIYQARQSVKGSAEIEDEIVLADLENAVLEGELAPKEFEKARHSLERHKLESLVEEGVKEDRSTDPTDTP